MKKSKQIIYWIATLWLALGMLSTGLVQLLKVKTGPGGLDSMTHLGYPIYFTGLLAIWKLLGLMAILLPKFALVKEWAYAGFFFALSGAIYSHLAVGDEVQEIFPALLLLVLSIVSWYFRPASRSIYASNKTKNLS